MKMQELWPTNYKNYVLPLHIGKLFQFKIVLLYSYFYHLNIWLTIFPHPLSPIKFKLILFYFFPMWISFILFFHVLIFLLFTKASFKIFIFLIIFYLYTNFHIDLLIVWTIRRLVKEIFPRFVHASCDFHVL